MLTPLRESRCGEALYLSQRSLVAQLGLVIRERFREEAGDLVDLGFGHDQRRAEHRPFAVFPVGGAARIEQQAAPERSGAAFVWL
jgi:hypothetical protein